MLRVRAQIYGKKMARAKGCRNKDMSAMFINTHTCSVNCVKVAYDNLVDNTVRVDLSPT